MAFGAWALTVGKVGFSVSVVAAMTMGIVVDDSVHFLSKYLRARREKNLGSRGRRPLRLLHRRQGPRRHLRGADSRLPGAGPVHLQTKRRHGPPGGLTIAFALLADFFLLPQLLMLIDRKDEVGETAGDYRITPEPLEPRPRHVER